MVWLERDRLFGNDSVAAADALVRDAVELERAARAKRQLTISDANIVSASVPVVLELLARSEPALLRACGRYLAAAAPMIGFAESSFSKAAVLEQLFAHLKVHVVAEIQSAELDDHTRELTAVVKDRISGLVEGEDVLLRGIEPDDQVQVRVRDTKGARTLCVWATRPEQMPLVCVHTVANEPTRPTSMSVFFDGQKIAERVVG